MATPKSVRAKRINSILTPRKEGIVWGWAANETQGKIENVRVITRSLKIDIPFVLFWGSTEFLTFIGLSLV
jgi:hypothetical protein